MTSYGGLDNLEVLDAAAVNYQAFFRVLLKSHIPNGCSISVLDFGAGTGTYARMIADSGCEVICAELDELMRQRLVGDGFNAVNDLSEVNGREFDLIYSFNVLEHIQDDLGVLKSFRRLVKDSGSVLLYVPAFQSLFTAMDIKVGHCRRYRYRQLESLLREAGFIVNTWSYVDSLGFPVTLLYRLFGARDGSINYGSVAVYDRWIFPLSRILDRYCGRIIGKNLVVSASPI